MRALRESQKTGTEVVVMEVLAGATTLIGNIFDDCFFCCEFLPLTGLSDYEDAAALYRQCGHAGKTLRSLTDYLIAVDAIRTDAELFHADRDFNTIARHAPLGIALCGLQVSWRCASRGIWATGRQSLVA